MNQVIGLAQRYRFTCCFWGLFLATTAAADELFSELDYLTDIPQVVSATRLPQHLTKAPAAITIIDRAMIDAAPVLRVEDLFRLVPGMQALSVTRNSTMVTYHGVADNFPDNLEVMVDGRSIYLPFLSTVDWSGLGLSLEDIDHIEVVRGSNVPAYGSNAFLGAINIVTRSPLAEAGSSARLLAGSQQQELFEARHAGYTDDLNYRLSVGHRHNEGSELFKDSQTVRFANLSVAFTPTLQDTLDLQLGVNQAEMLVGSADTLDEQFVPAETQSDYQYLRWGRELDSGQALQLTLSRSMIDLAMPEFKAEELILREFSQVPDMATALQLARLQGVDGVAIWSDSATGRATMTELELQYTHHLTSELGLMAGAGYRWETVNSPMQLTGEQRINEERSTLFGNIQWQSHPQLVWNVGGMLEHFSATRYTRFSPRLALNYLVTERSALRASYTRAYRMPSLLDANLQSTIYNNQGQPWNILTVNNPNLKPEQLDSYELGSYWRSDTGRLELDMRLYYEQISDGMRDRFYLLQPADHDGYYSRKENIASWRNQGLDLQLKLQPWHNAMLWLAYGYQDVQGGYFEGVKPVSLAVGNPGMQRLDNAAPAHTFSLTYDQQLNPDWQYSVANYFMSEVDWPEGGPRSSFWRTDMKVSHQLLKNSKWQLEGSLLVQNLFDKDYAEFYPFNKFDRRVYFQLAVKTP